MSYEGYDPIDLARRIEQRIGGDTIMALVSLLGRLDNIVLLIQALELEDDDVDASPKTRKVLVMGASEVELDGLRRITRKAGYDDSWFEYRLDYRKLSRRAIGSLRNSSYSAVIVGPMPHSAEGRGHASSAIQTMKDHPESYPPVVEVRDAHGINITNNGFRAALVELEELFAA